MSGNLLLGPHKLMPVFFNPVSWTPVVLAWSFLLLPFGRSSKVPMFIMAILGGTLIWKHGRHAVWEGGAKAFSLLFLCIWVFDALVQAMVGYDLLGYAYPERLNGLSGPYNWKFGLTLAMLSPIVWEYVSRHGAKWQLALAWLGTGAVVLLASNREHS